MQSNHPYKETADINYEQTSSMHQFDAELGKSQTIRIKEFSDSAKPSDDQTRPPSQLEVPTNGQEKVLESQLPTGAAPSETTGAGQF
mmetsp:Transcript_36984/g.56669  ORF Transcript_36984/g.56669 Transcript_36984/m.56669 type:complete len:87 (+) Transcript_36984:5047-5307(+)